MFPRRRFLKLLSASLSASSLLAHKFNKLKSPIYNYQLDAYGGWKGKEFKATGFFRTEHDGKRWWLVTPCGNAFISFGVNHYHAGWWAQKHNQSYWKKQFKAEYPFDANWNEGFKNAALSDLKRLGINTLGIHTDAPMLTEPPGKALFPYVAEFSPLKLSHYLSPSPETYMDVFSKDYALVCEQVALETVAPYARDSMILGFCMADCPIFTDTEAQWYNNTTFPRQIRNLGPSSPGKATYLKLMSERYDRIDNFNRVYQTTFSSWEALLKAEQWRKDQPPQNTDEAKDNTTFLEHCVNQYYKTAKDAFKRHNPNHLFFGDKINGNTDGLDAVLKISSRYTDLVNFQYYDRLENHETRMQSWSEKISRDQPILNGDSAFTVPTETMPNPYGPHCQSQEERAQMTEQYMKQSLCRNNFVGWHMCGIIDTIKTMPGKESHQHQGLMTTHGDYYQPMEKSIQAISQALYHNAEQAIPS